MQLQLFVVTALLVVVAGSTFLSHLRRPAARRELDLKVLIGLRKAWYAANRTNSSESRGLCPQRARLSCSIRLLASAAWARFTARRIRARSQLKVTV